MGRPMKHTSSKPSRGMRRGNVGIRTGKGNVGPTSVTGYYNTIVPSEVGKYVVYRVGSSGAPLSWTPQNDTEFIRLTNELFGSISTVSEGLTAISEDDDFTVAAILNTTGSTDINPFAVYNDLGTNPGVQGEWFNTCSPLDREHIDEKQHCLQEFVAMRGTSNVRWGAPYTGTIIYEIDTSGNVTTKVSSTSSPSSGTFSTTQGYRYVGNKPVHFHDNSDGDAMCPVSYYGKNWGWYFTRYEQQTVRFYCHEDSTIIRIFKGNDAVANSNLYTTLTGNEGDIVEYTFPTSNTNKYFNIYSNNFIVMTGRGSSGDMMIGALAGDRVYRRYDEFERTIGGTSPDGTSTYTVADSTEKVWAVSIADGSGGDSETSMPLEELSKNYALGYYLRSYFIVSPYDQTVTISSWNGSSWVEFSSHTLSGASLTGPATANSGSQAGGDRFNSHTLWKFEGSDPFYIVVNDDSRDEEMLLGWGSGEVEAFFL